MAESNDTNPRQAFEAVGLTGEVVARKIAEGISLAEKTQEEVLAYVKALQDGEEELNSSVVKQLAKMCAKLVDDRHLTLKYIQEYNRMVGAHAPVKKAIDVDVTPAGAVEEYDLSGLSTEKIRELIRIVDEARRE